MDEPEIYDITKEDRRRLGKILLGTIATGTLIGLLGWYLPNDTPQQRCKDAQTIYARTQYNIQSAIGASSAAQAKQHIWQANLDDLVIELRPLQRRMSEQGYVCLKYDVNKLHEAKDELLELGQAVFQGEPYTPNPR